MSHLSKPSYDEYQHVIVHKYSSAEAALVADLAAACVVGYQLYQHGYSLLWSIACGLFWQLTLLYLIFSKLLEI